MHSAWGPVMSERSMKACLKLSRTQRSFTIVSGGAVDRLCALLALSMKYC